MDSIPVCHHLVHVHVGLRAGARLKERNPKEQTSSEGGLFVTGVHCAQAGCSLLQGGGVELWCKERGMAQRHRSI